MTQHLDRYTCEEMIRRLDDYLDRELTPGETRRVEEHLTDCEACVREFGFEASMLRAVRAKLRDVEVPEALADRVAMSLARERADRDGNGSS